MQMILLFLKYINEACVKSFKLLQSTRDTKVFSDTEKRISKHVFI